MRHWLLFSSVLLLCLPVSAWGPVASRYVCSEAGRFVWGEDEVAKCLHGVDNATLDEFCESSYLVLGADYEAKCRSALAAGVQIDPSTVSAEIFQDDANHFDYSRCPVSGTARPWVCGDGSRPAYDVALKWLKEAETASSPCARIYDFCTAASYYADSESSLHQVRYAEECVKNIEESADRSIASGTHDWSASQLCNFNNQEKGLGNINYRQRMGESASTLNKVIGNLTVRGYALKAMQYTPKKGVVVLANSIDSKAAKTLLEYLKSKGVNVISSDAAEFERLKYNSRIVILGGHNSPEGVGQATSSVISHEEEEALLTPGAAYMFEKGGIWAQGQKVVVLAGNEATDTEKVSSDYRDKVLEVVK